MPSILQRRRYTFRRQRLWTPSKAAFRACWAAGANAIYRIHAMKKNVAGQKIGAQLVSATDGSAFTGSVTVSVTVDAGTQATGTVGSGACTHEGNGYHTYAPSQAETNGDLLAFTFTGSGAIPVTIQVYTIPTTGILAPTVADRTLDVSAGGEAGIDWANVGTPSSTVSLTNTTVATVTTTTTATNVTTVNGLAANVITAASIAASALNGKGDWFLASSAPSNFSALAITAGGIVQADLQTIKTQTVTCSGGVTIPAATLASTTNITAGTITTVSGNVNGSVGSVTGAVGSVTGNVGGNVVGSVASVTGNVGGNVVGSVASVTAAVAITSNIKKNQALAKFQFMMTDSTNHEPATGKTVTCTRSIDGAAFAAGTLANVTEVSNGMYTVDFGAGDLNGNVIVLRATATGCDDTFERIVSQP